MTTSATRTLTLPVPHPATAIRFILLAFALLLPLLYDPSVPEVSGDIRWSFTHLAAGLVCLMGLWAWWENGEVKFSLRWPPLMWFALGLAIWAAVSLIDALAFDRGIVLIKALYAQLLLMAGVYMVWKPSFSRRLAWVLVIPLPFLCWVGICQFMGWNDAAFANLLKNTWLFAWLGYIWPNGGPGNFGLIDPFVSFYLQSAVPGSTFANKNLAGSYTVLILPLVLYLLVTAKTRWGRTFTSAIFAVGMLFLVYSRSRASWLALLIGLGLLAALLVYVPAWRRALFAEIKPWVLGACLLPTLLLCLLCGSATSPIQAHALDRSPGEQVQALATASWDEIGGRVAYNLNSLMIIKDHWFNGVGLGSFYSIYPAYHDAVVATPTNSYNIMARPQRTHTDLMQAFDEMGIPGGVCYAALLLSGLVMAWRLGGRNLIRLTRFNLFLATATAYTLTGGVYMALTRLRPEMALSGWVDVLWVLGGIGVLAWGVLVAKRIRRKGFSDVGEVKLPLQGLFPLFAGISLFTISFNALMDFPMQLPTAPAVVALLLGAIAGHYRAAFTRNWEKHSWGLDYLVALPKMWVLPMMAIWLVVTGWALWDDYKFRQGNQMLKDAMIRIFSNVNDDETLRKINEAQETYPWDPRIQEHVAVVYANYRGNRMMSLEERIEKLEWILEKDPWGPNHLVNLSGQYLQQAEININAGNRVVAERALARVEELYQKLQRVGGFSHFTWGVGGMMRLIQGRDAEAQPLLERALAIDPTYAPAVNGLQIIQARRGAAASPVPVSGGLAK